MKGWIKLHRKILDNGVFEDANLLKIFIWCILKCNSKEKEKNIYGAKLKQGEFITGRLSASEELYMKPSTVQDRLKRLQRMNYIKIKSTTRYTIINVLKFKQYQLKENQPLKDIKQRYLDFYDEVKGFNLEYEESVLNGFISYWTEKNKSKTKMRFEMQQTWETKRRLKTWLKNNKHIDKKESKIKTQINNWQKAREIINEQD